MHAASSNVYNQRNACSCTRTKEGYSFSILLTCLRRRISNTSYEVLRTSYIRTIVILHPLKSLLPRNETILLDFCTKYFVLREATSSDAITHRIQTRVQSILRVCGSYFVQTIIIARHGLRTCSHTKSLMTVSTQYSVNTWAFELAPDPQTRTGHHTRLRLSTCSP